MKDTLVVVAKRPTPGETKTRLCPPLTGEQAAQLYECFLLDTLEIVRRVPDVERVIAYLPESAGDYFRQLAPDMFVNTQRGDTLGERLDNLLSERLQAGSERVVVVNSDGPTLPPAYIQRAFSQLERVDLVLGPTQDGGYYLVGMKEPPPPLFQSVQMSTPRVLEDTTALAEQSGLSVSLTPTWYDVDTMNDLQWLEQELRQSPDDGAPNTRDWLRSFSKDNSLNV